MADSLSEIFPLAALRRSRRSADARHPFGYGKERFFWALLAAVGIFVMGGRFSFYQGLSALRGGDRESRSGYVAGLVVLGVAFLAEGASPARALLQARGEKGPVLDLALRTVIAEDGTAVLGVSLAIAGMSLHPATGSVVWEAAASLGHRAAPGLRRLPARPGARDQLVGESVDPELRRELVDFLMRQRETDNVAELLTMRPGMDSVLVRPASTWLPASTASGWRRSRCASGRRCATGGRRGTRSSWTSRTPRRAAAPERGPRCATGRVGRGWVLDRSG